MREYKEKTLENAVKDVDVKRRKVTGYYLSFGVKDSYGEIIKPGASKKSVGERGPQGANRIFHLLYHNWALPINKPSILKEDSFGLYFETEFPDTTIANDALKMYEAGAFNEHSIGYEEIGIDHKEDAIYLNEIKLYEGSTVLLGANPQTPFTGLKTEQELNKLQSKMDILQKLLRDSNISDETMIAIEATIKQLYTELKATPKEVVPLEAHNQTQEPTVKEDEILFRLNLWESLNKTSERLKNV